MANSKQGELNRDTDRLFEIDGRHGLWSIPAWCAQYGCSAPYYYKLVIRPREVKIGRLVRVTESPRDYAERARRAQLAAHSDEACAP